MAHNFEKLEQSSKNLINKLNEFKVGAKNYSNHTPIEEKILRLNEINNCLQSKATSSKILDHQTKSSSTKINLQDAQKQLMDKIIAEILERKAFNSAYLSHTSQELFTNDTDDPVFIKFREEITQQYESLKLVNEKLKVVLQEQENILNESFETKLDLMSKQNEYSEFITKQKAIYANKVTNKKTENEELAQKCKLQLKKLNFMQIITRRLLLFSDVDWNDELLEIFEQAGKTFFMNDFDS